MDEIEAVTEAEKTGLLAELGRLSGAQFAFHLAHVPGELWRILV